MENIVISDNSGLVYKGDMWFNRHTPEGVMNTLNKLYDMSPRKRVRIFYGDAETGMDWHETYDVMGYIGRCMGEKPFPILVHDIRSCGGTAILTANIVKITCGHDVLWRHPSYNNRLTFMVTGDGAYDIMDGKNVVLFHSDDQNKAARMFKFMKGDSNRF